jgi:ferredoxin
MVTVHIDGELCQANGLCIQVAPDLFMLADDDDVVQLATNDLEAREAEARAAAMACPVRALTVTER